MLGLFSQVTPHGVEQQRQAGFFRHASGERSPFLHCFQVGFMQQMGVVDQSCHRKPAVGFHQMKVPGGLARSLAPQAIAVQHIPYLGFYLMKRFCELGQHQRPVMLASHIDDA